MEKAAKKPSAIRYLAAVAGLLIILLGILDVISTNLVLAAGGIEQNPIVAWTMRYLEAWWHMPKILIHVTVGFLVFHMLKTRFTAALAFLLVLFYGAVVHHNLTLIL